MTDLRDAVERLVGAIAKHAGTHPHHDDALLVWRLDALTAKQAILDLVGAQWAFRVATRHYMSRSEYEACEQVGVVQAEARILKLAGETDE